MISISSRLRCLALGLLGQSAVNVLVGQSDAKASSEGNKTFCSIGRDGLPALVMNHVALGTTDSVSQRGLGDSEPLSDGFYGAHAPYISGACSICQQRRLLFLYERG